jgi:hypothetical protein
MTLLASQEARMKHEAGALSELAAEVRRLADKPAPTIHYTPPDIHVAAPIVPTPQVTVDLSTLPVPEVHVHVSPPKPRRIRVEENKVTGERTYTPEDIEEQ